MAALTVPTPALLIPLEGDYGWFGWNIARGTAVWSESVHRLHGYHPGAVAPSSTLTFHHKHPDDLYGCIDALHAAMVGNRLVVHEHRLVDADEQVRSAVMICRPVSDSRGRMRNLRGFLLPTDAEARPVADDAFAAQAPLAGVLMNAFGVSRRAAHVLIAARRPMTARRSLQQQDFARSYAATGPGDDLRRTLEDSLFPLEHLILEPLDLAA